MRLTPKAQEHMEEYVARLRVALHGRDDVDAADVESGIREHVEAGLSARSIDVATAEDVSDLLAGLGAPEAMALEGGTATADAERGGHDSWGGAAAALGLVVFGLALFVLNSPVWWVASATGVLLARAFLPTSRPPRGPGERVLLWVWQLAVAVGAVGALLGPAALVWASAQIGGVLEGPLEAFIDVGAGERPPRYWAAMAAAAGTVTGLWWLVLGLVLGRYGGGACGLLGPARRMIPEWAARALVVVGGLLLAAAIVGGWLI